MPYIVNGADIEPRSKYDTFEILKFLPAGTYNIRRNPLTKALYLSKDDVITKPTHYFGQVDKHNSKYIKMFEESKKSLGILFSGLKGAGKSFQARCLAADCLEKNIPVIVIQKFFEPDDIIALIKLIDTSCMVIFDEFEKTFEIDDQAKFLPLFDGINDIKHMFVITANHADDDFLHDALINRPGRIHYHKRFKNIQPKYITEYCEQHLNNKKFIKEIRQIAVELSTRFSFDILKTLVNECNMFNESPFDFIDELNIEQEGQYIDYIATSIKNWSKHNFSDISTARCQYKRNTHRNVIYCYSKGNKEDYIDADDIYFNDSNIVEYLENGGLKLNVGGILVTLEIEEDNVWKAVKRRK